jgi:hypothetical protein
LPPAPEAALNLAADDESLDPFQRPVTFSHVLEHRGIVAACFAQPQAFVTKCFESQASLGHFANLRVWIIRLSELPAKLLQKRDFGA